MARRIGLHVLGVAGIGLMLSGCVAGNGGGQTVTRGDTRIISSSSLFARAKELTVIYDDPWSREDYTLFQSPEMQAEFLYATAAPRDDVSLDATPSFGLALQSWNINQAPLQAGQVWRTQKAGRAIFFQPYRLDRSGWGCVAIKSDWGAAPRDLRSRPTDLVFGYVCNKSAAVLSRQQAQRIVESLTFLDAARGTPAQRRLAIPAGVTSLAAVVRGDAGASATGISGFPFAYGQRADNNSGVGYGAGIGVGSSIGVYGTFGRRIGYGGYGPYDGYPYYSYPYYGYPYGGYGGYRDHDRHDRGDRGHHDDNRGGDGDQGGSGSGGNSGNGSGAQGSDRSSPGMPSARWDSNGGGGYTGEFSSPGGSGGGSQNTGAY